jgi:uncharacterized protein YkwD/uncharacterized membrane protein required for colicin V production
MNLVDLFLLGYIALYTLLRFRRGFIRLSLELAGLILSFAVALLGYHLVSAWIQATLHLQAGLSQALAFIVLLLIAETLVFALVRILIRLIPLPLIASAINRWAGLIPAAASAVIMTAILTTLAYGLPLPSGLRDQVDGSHLAHPLISRTQSLTEPIFGDAFQGLLGALTRQQEGERVDLGFKTDQVKVDEQAEQKMLELLNHERTAHGLSALTADTGRLRDVARAHSRDMFVRGYFAHEDPDGHSPFDRMQAGGVSFLDAGENLAYAPDVEIAHHGLMNSPPHRANILDPSFHQVGIGVVSAGFRGEMFTQDFTN